jgi:hypothetical protein
MIIIPEIETVVILVPRTGSGSLRRAIAKRYPKSILLYRHMEADGVPAGYDRWRKVGVVRDPVQRLHSLYHFLKNISGDHDAAWLKTMRTSVSMDFNDCLVNNRVIFTSPYDHAGVRFFPHYTVRHAQPENRKSQYLYLRPDLGTEVFQYREISRLERALDCPLPEKRENATSRLAYPTLTDEARDRICRFFAWDLQASA